MRKPEDLERVLLSELTETRRNLVDFCATIKVVGFTRQKFTRLTPI